MNRNRKLAKALTDAKSNSTVKKQKNSKRTNNK